MKGSSSLSIYFYLKARPAEKEAVPGGLKKQDLGSYNLPH
jgi:hypothetical protein